MKNGIKYLVVNRFHLYYFIGGFAAEFTDFPLDGIVVNRFHLYYFIGGFAAYWG